MPINRCSVREVKMRRREREEMDRTSGNANDRTLLPKDAELSSGMKLHLHGDGYFPHPTLSLTLTLSLSRLRVIKFVSPLHSRARVELCNTVHNQLSLIKCHTRRPRIHTDPTAHPIVLTTLCYTSTRTLCQCVFALSM